jgi:serine/threonine-protein kinase
MRPKRVGPYRLIDLLGAGGMGDVFRAYDERLKRWVAVKQVRLDDEDPQRGKRFRREAQATAVVNHPAIVQIHDVLATGDGEWIVMEYVEGKTLASLLRGGPLPLARALPLARQIAEGLAAAHARGIIHRDLKTENVMVTPAAKVKILDFGLAKRFRVDGYDSTDPDTWKSLAGRIVGTSRAMSPEQAQGLELDYRTDLFSLGTLLFEMLTGTSPFKGSSHIDTMNRVCTYQQPPARDLNGEVPWRLSELVDRLLEKDPRHRPRSVDEVVVTLDAIEVREREITETVPLVRSEAPAPRKAEEPTRPGRPLPPGARTPKPPFWRRLTAALRSLLSRGELGL